MSKGFSTINYKGPVTQAAKGQVAGGSTSGTARVRACFPQTPIIDEEDLKKLFVEKVLSGEVLDGFMFESFNRDYVGTTNQPAPDFTPDKDTSITVEGESIPSHFVPNPTSPGEGSLNPTDKPEAPDGFVKHTEQFGNGAGSKQGPATLRENLVAARETFGTYIKGKAIQG